MLAISSPVSIFGKKANKINMLRLGKAFVKPLLCRKKSTILKKLTDFSYLFVTSEGKFLNFLTKRSYFTQISTDRPFDRWKFEDY
jgi:hypothetical protein